MTSLRVRALVVALLLLLPLAGEAALREAGPVRMGLAALGYLLACLLFAWLAPPVSQAVTA